MASRLFRHTPAFPFDEAWKQRSDRYKKQEFFAPTHKIFDGVPGDKPGFERVKPTATVESYANKNDRPLRYGERRDAHEKQKFNKLKNWSRWSPRLGYL